MGQRMATVSSGSDVSPLISLAVALRMLAGGSYLDLAFGYDIGDSTVNPILWKVINAIDKHINNIYFPLEDPVALKILEKGFSNILHGSYRGAVAADDGVVFRRNKPAKCDSTDNVTAYFTRKGYYAHGMQAFVDSKCRFLSISMQLCASSHDATAYILTSLKTAIDDCRLPFDYHIVLDEAYRCTEQELSPWRGRKINEDKDTFNYFLSLNRQVVERAFGILVGRWGIFWRPLRFATDKITLLLRVLASCTIFASMHLVKSLARTVPQVEICIGCVVLLLLIAA
jgi:hypothetical protein